MGVQHFSTMWFYLNVLLIFLLVKNSLMQDGKPTIKILAPQFICSASNDSSSSIGPPGVTNIRIRTKSGQKLSLKWTVRFETINGPKGQRFNLMVWRIVRKLERTLNDMSPQIVESNNVAINNSMLIDGVKYIFKVFGVSDEGIKGDADTFAIKYTSPKDDPTLQLKDTESDEQVSILMFGSDVVYADAPYTVEALVIPCKPTNDYYFNWIVSDVKDKSTLNVGSQLGKKLVIPPGKLVGGRMYDITFKIYHITDKKSITTSGLFISTLKRGLSVDLSCEKVTIGKNVPFSITATLNNPDNIKEPANFNWVCKKLSDSSDCKNIPSSVAAELNLEGGFDEEGIYQVELQVTKGNTGVTNKCEIIVKDEMLPLIEIGNNRKVFASNMPFEIQTQIFDLRPGCTLQWSILNEEGFGYFEPYLLPDVFEKKVSINSLEETFLSEIIEFGNNTFSRNYPLIIPMAYNNWPGLEAEKMYKFRLLVECVCTPSVFCEGPNEVTAYSDVSIQTNGPPTLEPLSVTPSMGVALQTKFTFSTKAATDVPSDYPLWYMFGIKISDADIVYINYYVDHFVVDTFLPYSDSPIIPVLTVCDSRGACDSIQGDPILLDTPSTVTTAELDFFKDKFKTSLYRQEYKDAFFLATVILLTLKGMNYEEQFVDSLTFVDMETRSTIAKIIALPEKIDITTANYLVQEATYFIQKFNTLPEELLQDILKLRDVLFDIVSQSSSGLTMARRKRNVFNLHPEINFDHKLKLRFKRDVSLDDVKNFLKVSEFIINTTKDEATAANEKRKMLSNIIKSTPDLCRKTTKYPSFLDSQYTHLSFEKINLRHNMPILSIPYIPHMGGKIGSSSIANMQFVSSDKLNSKMFCLAKYLFHLDILSPTADENQRGSIYHASLYSDEATGIYKETSEDYPVVLKIPVPLSLMQTESEVYECRRWIDGTWFQGTCETNDRYETVNTRIYVVCRCDNLGYISLYISQNKPQVTEEIIYPEIVTTDVYITETLPDETTTQTNGENDTMDMTTSKATIITHSTQITESVCDKKGCQKSSQSIMVPATVSVTVVLLCIAMIVFIILKRRNLKKKKKIDSTRDDKILLVKKNQIQTKGPKYRKFYADHLMEGSSESLARYNILQDMSLEE